MKRLPISIGIYVAFVFVPLVSFAATVSVDITVPMGGRNYTVAGDITSMTFSDPQLDVVLGNGESITVTSPGNTKLVFDRTATVDFAFVESCTSTSYNVKFTNSSATAKTVNVTPSESSCAVTGSVGGGSSGSGSSSGSGGGGGGGGGGGVSGPTSSTVTAIPAPATAGGSIRSLSSGTSPFTIISDLDLDSEGNEVSQLQTYLASKSELYPEGRITGYFGPMTQRAVKRFQQTYGLPAVGRVGPLTRSKLAEIFGGGSIPPSAPTSPVSPSPLAPASSAAINRLLKVGSEGNDVSALQTFLAKDVSVYPEGIVSGYFGAATQRAIKRFQEKYGIDPVGHVGPATRAKLNELMSGAGTAAPGAPSAGSVADDQAKVLELQAQLKALQDQLKVLQGQ